MSRLFDPVLRFPKLVLLACFACTAFFVAHMRGLELETDVREWVPQHHPEVAFDDYVRDVFDVVGGLFIGVERTGPGGIYTPEVLRYIAEVSARIEQVDGVIEGETVSLAVADNIIGTAEGLEVVPFIDEVPTTPEDLAALRAAVRGNSVYFGHLVSADEQATFVYAKVLDEKDREDLYDDVEALLAEIPPPADTAVLLGGRPTLEGAIARLIRSELAYMPLLSNGLMILMLAVVMRSGRGVVLPVLVVTLSNCIAFGAMGLTGVKLYSMSTMIVPLLVAMGVADGIHMINCYTRHVLEDSGADRRDIVRRMLDEMTVPVIMTSLTTAGGFLALSFAPVLPIMFFGIFTAVGILAAMVFSLVLIPAVLVLLPRHAPRHARLLATGRSLTIFDRFLRGVQGVVLHRPGWVLAGAAAVLVAGSVQALRLKTNTSLTGNINADNPAILAERALNRHFEGTTDLAVVFDGTDADAIKDPAMLAAIDRLQAFAERQPLVGGSTSIVEYIKRMHEAMNADDPAFYRIPDNRNLVAQYLLLYSLSGDPDDFSDLVDYDYQQARVRVHLRSDHSSKVFPAANAIREYLAETFPPEQRPRVAGRANISLVMHELVLRGQFVTLAISVTVVYLLAAGMLRSLTGGVVACLPIGIATVLNFAMMTSLGIPLGVGNSTMAAIGIGIGIDYAIHYLAKFRALTSAGMTFEEAVTATTTTTGRSILFNALVVAAGYLVNLASKFPPTVTLGVIVSFNMVTSFLGAMLIMPVVIHMIRPKFLRAANAVARPIGSRVG